MSLPIPDERKRQERVMPRQVENSALELLEGHRALIKKRIEEIDMLIEDLQLRKSAVILQRDKIVERLSELERQH